MNARWGRARVTVAAACAAGIAVTGFGGAGAAARPAGTPAASARAAASCPQPAAPRDPRNPLMISGGGGANPLTGVHLFVDGPRHGAVAKAIEKLLGIDPNSYPDSYSAEAFLRDINTGRLHARAARNPRVYHQILELEKIVSQPESERVSYVSAGGGPGAIFAQTTKVSCLLPKADPGSVPLLVTYFLFEPGKYCKTRAEVLARRGSFRRHVDEFAAAVGRRPVVALLELDAIGSSKCLERTGALGLWEQDIRYEINKISALPHTVAYIEAGYADAESPAYTARALANVGIAKIRGFFTNDTHADWTSAEISWGQEILRRLARRGIVSHFIVNTAGNGHGPLIPRDRVHKGNEVLCNPPGRGIGWPTTISPGFPGVDAFLWAGEPGFSSGSCNGGPPVGNFWVARGVEMATLANRQLGPGYPSRPY